MKNLLLWSQLLLALIIISCDSNEFKKSEHGFEYKFFVQNEGDSLEVGKLVLMKIDYYNEDTLMMSTSDPEMKMPMVLNYTERVAQDSIPLVQALKMMTKGDSAVFKFNTEQLFSKSFNQPVPDSINAESNMFVYMKIQDIMSQEEYSSYMENMMNKIHAEEIIEIDETISEAGETADTLSSGLRVVVMEEGTGPSPEQGDSVTVHYTGKLINGTKFDSSVDRGKPFTFQLGVGRVIQGWDEGIAQLKEGAKAKLYIPSKLGYGFRGNPGIPPFSTLVFDVELLEVKKQ